MAHHRLRVFILRLGIGLLVLSVVAIIALILLPDRLIRTLAGSKGSAALDRIFSIDGPIAIDWDWTTPYVHLSDIHLANTAGAPDADMVSINKLDFHLKIWRLLEGQLNLPDIAIDSPVIILEKHADGSANWQFPTLSKANAATSAALPSHRGNVPLIGQLTVNKGKLIYRDQAKKLDVTLGIQTASAGSGENGAFVLSGDGKLQNKPFQIAAQGGSLEMLRNSTQQYPLHFHIKMADTVVDINGTFLDPVKMEGVDAKLEMRGDNLADLFYLTLLPLPPTPAYSLSGHLTKQGDIWTLENFTGKVGGSDLHGHMTDDISGQRSLLKAELESHLLDMKDLAGFTGATPAPRKGDESSPAQIAKATAEKANARLIPDVPLDLDRLRASDMDVSLKADRLLAPGLPMDTMNVRFLLESGVLRIDPLEFGMAAGTISGTLILDGSKAVPRMKTDLSLSRLNIKRFFEGTSFAAQTSGMAGGQFQVTGNGRSLSQVLADSTGHVAFVISGGSMSALLVDAAGLDLGGAATDLLGSDKAASIRCAVADFDDADGMLASKIFVIDTSSSNISGQASINLKNETLNGKIQAEPKNPTLTAHAPITLSGTLKKPSVGIDHKEAAARGTVAGVLSVFLTPLVAVIPFIETGVGKDSDCGNLIAQARSHSGKAP